MNKQASLMVAVALLLSFLNGCTAPGRSYVKSAMVETLEVEVRPDTSKMFTYRLQWPEGQIPSYIRVENGSGSSRAYDPMGVNIERGTYERLLKNTEYAVKQAGYCREGFLELDRSMSRYHLWIRGECKEGATAADQKAFGPNKTLTPKDWGSAHS